MRPIVGVPACRRMIGKHPFHAVGDKYLAAVREGSDATPLLIPSFENPLEIDEILDSVQGLLFTGSPSNVDPSHYGAARADENMLLDPVRDGSTLPLLRAAVERGVPVLAICRGFQELNVALGGSLFQRVQDQPGRMDHRENPEADVEIQYGPAHRIDVVPGGLLSRITGQTAFQVNSLHSQGIDRLAAPLLAEALAPDGQIEAVSSKIANGFLLGVQWHPEWRWRQNAASRSIYAAFGAALRA